VLSWGYLEATNEKEESMQASLVASLRAELRRMETQHELSLSINARQLLHAKKVIANLKEENIRLTNLNVKLGQRVARLETQLGGGLDGNSRLP